MINNIQSIYEAGFDRPKTPNVAYCMFNGEWTPITQNFEKWEIFDNFINVIDDPENFIKIARDQTTGITIVQYCLKINSNLINDTLEVLSSNYCPVTKPYILSGTPFTCMGPISRLKFNSSLSNTFFCIGSERCFIDIGNNNINNQIIEGGLMTITDKNVHYNV